jgi:3-(3-hydroxy-phenyl)propionate hydroxylase
VSVYTFACARMRKFRFGRLFFAGDSAHGVSPFGARGANSGIQDANNLGWKLDAVLKGVASKKLLDSYCAERELAADENIMNSTRSTDFITPKSEVSRLFRDAALSLAKDHPFARRIVNSGRLSLPSSYLDSPLNTPDEETWDGGVPPGAPAVDARLFDGNTDTWFTDVLNGEFIVAVLKDAMQLEIHAMESLQSRSLRASLPWIERYAARPGTTYLFRRDQHVAARWRTMDSTRIQVAMAHALGE